jgi:hypothetical protein
MRRIAQTLAVTSAVLGLGLTALPSFASPLRTANGATRAEHAAPRRLRRSAWPSSVPGG